ncbi:hypothetical protein [Neobacillus niacini]|uniref:hypothetical protein n=1 Tax=Neobacillus niacini TaxID=86668 RepID=UPI000A7E900A|nr:hypothetical protein [Neobacillus niacini]
MAVIFSKNIQYHPTFLKDEGYYGICWNEKVGFSNTNYKLMNEMGYVYEETKETK